MRESTGVQDADAAVGNGGSVFGQGPLASSALTSPRLEAAGFRHAFFTRRGGVSPPPWESLNFAVSTGDAIANVRENRARAAAWLGVASERLYFLSQVHGVAWKIVGGDEAWSDLVEAVGDITITGVAGVACGVRSADCVPILVGDRTSGAVAAIHSGWKGTVANAAAAGVRALREVVGDEGDLVAAIGPHIGACCFEIGADVAGQLAAASVLGDAAVLAGARLRGDLRRIVRAQLEAVGLRGEAIDDVGGCTVCEPERFHSYRRDGAASGRMLSAIVGRCPETRNR